MDADAWDDLGLAWSVAPLASTPSLVIDGVSSLDSTTMVMKCVFACVVTMCAERFNWKVEGFMSFSPKIA